MSSPIWIKTAIFLAAALWAAILVLRGADLDPAWLTPLGGVAGVVVVLFMSFDRFAWKWPLIRRLVRRRVLHGTWRGELASYYKDPVTGQTIPPIDVCLVIHQTYTEVSASLMTKESKSRSINASFGDPARGQCLLSAIYMNTPELLIQDRSRIHRGGLILEVSGRPPRLLEGFYFTDRDTKGQLRLDEYSTETYEDFEHALQGTYVRR